MKKRFYALLPLLPILAGNPASAQRTGSFDTTVAFNAAPRAVSMYVPAGYDPANKYRLMVCLHGLGDTCSNYRNGLTGSLGWASAMPNTIFICPENDNRNTDFYTSANGEDIIPASIDFVMSQYHIDSANVVLQGFSLGGRAALRYGLDHPDDLKGLLLNTPAIQGVKEALNGPAYSFSYFNAPRIPVFITHGGTDFTYTAPIDSCLEQLILNDGIVKFQRFPSLGHGIPPVQQMLHFLPFFDTSGHPGKDLEITKLMLPLRSCTAQVSPEALIRNTGRETITDGTVEVRVGQATPMTFTVKGILQPFEHAIIPLPPQTLASGNNTISIELKQLNGTSPDTVVGNNKATAHVEYAATGMPLPLNEGFEGASFPPPGWQQEQSGEFYSAWTEDPYVYKSGNKSANAFNTILVFDNGSRSESLITPAMNLQSATNPQLSFDIAYNFHRYTPPYFTQNVDFADTLEVQISTDCGGSYSTLFRKGGEDLTTFMQPILNPLDLNSCYAEPEDSNWHRIRIGLGNYSSATMAAFRFRYISGLGGSINIDNLSIASATSVKQSRLAAVNVYPNPASSLVNIDPGAEPISRVSILDVTGKTVRSISHETQMREPFSIDLAGIAPGLYSMQIFSETGLRIVKLSVR